MRYMFSGEYYNKMIFNEDIGGWNVENVVDFEGMFRFAQSFNQNIGSWSTSQATSMAGMFKGAIVFNQDISSWNVSSVIDMRSMFDGALVFDKDITTWTGVAARSSSTGYFRPSSRISKKVLVSKCCGWSCFMVFMQRELRSSEVLHHPRCHHRLFSSQMIIFFSLYEYVCRQQSIRRNLNAMECVTQVHLVLCQAGTPVWSQTCRMPFLAIPFQHDISARIRAMLWT